MNYWLIKSEADLYPISKFKKDKQTQWTDIRNYQARNNLREMKVGDQALYYHSNAKPNCIAGTAEVKKSAYPDPGQFDPKNEYYDSKSKKDDPTWIAPDLNFASEFTNPLSVEELKKHKELSQMELFRNSRLSVQKVTKKEFDFILKLAENILNVAEG